MENQIPWDKIHYYINKPSAEYDSGFSSWLNESDSNQKIWEEVCLTYRITGDLPEEFDPDQLKAWARIDRRINLNQRRISLNPVFFKVAAAIILFFIGGLSSWYFLQDHEVQYTQVFSPYGHKTKVVLPDRSVVWLNGNSSLKYETDFKDSRQVEVSGEALFQVTKDPGNVFCLRSGDVRVEVYGTRFNFKHYPEDQHTELALLEGSVGFFNQNKLLTKMVPGEVVNLDQRTNSFKVDRENLDLIVSWSTDELVIENQSFGEVLKYLERWYGVRFHYDENLPLDQHLSFKVKTESLPELLTSIKHLTSINYKIEGENVELSK